MSRPTVIVWRNRYDQAGIAGLGDLPRSGRPPVIDALEVVVATLAAPPEHFRLLGGANIRDDTPPLEQLHS